MASIAVLGRTRMLMEAAERLVAAGHRISLVATAFAEPHHAARPEDFEAFAASVGAPFVFVESHRSSTLADAVRAAGGDVAISINWPVILDERTIATFPLGVLNAHAGDLPRFRGNACPNWAILLGETHIGLSVHQMEPGTLDSGPVVCRDRMTLSDDTYIADCYDWLELRVPELLVEAVEGLLAGSLVPVPQSDDPATWLRCYPRRPEDGRIDWRRSTVQVHRLVRASSRPFEGAHTLLEGEHKAIIWRAEPIEHAGPFAAIPGQILFRVDGDVVVACGDGALRLTEVGLDNTASHEQASAAIGRSLRSRFV